MVAPLGARTRSLDLGGDRWELTYQREALGEIPTDLGSAVEQGYRRVPAVVPGSVEHDLERAGELPDLFIGANITQARDLEHGDWWYRTEIDVPADWDKQRTRLVLDGVDTIATVFLNGTIVGETDNMFVPHEIDLSSAVEHGTNELAIHLHSPLRHAEQFDAAAYLQQTFGSYESLWVRKPAHMYGWDIAPRIVSAGLHRGVRLVERPADALAEWYLTTHSLAQDRSSARLIFFYDLTRAPRTRDVRLTVRGRHEGSGSSFEIDLEPTFRTGRADVEVPDPALWEPRSYGEPNLYDVEIALSVDGDVTDSHRTRTGIRTIALDHHVAPMPDGRFRVVVNGRPVRVLGTNWVPLDALHARDAERLPQALELLWESGCNTVRCWGGNLYEDAAFFDWCDEHGILVWQDFALGCGRYPQQEPFVSALRDEASTIVRKLRNHASLMLWCGSNENDDNHMFDGVDPDGDVLTRQVLPEAVRLHDWARPYIVGSPAYTGDMVRAGTTPAAPERHSWGARAGFKAPFYSTEPVEFVSEVGFHGSPNDASLTRFLPDNPRIDPRDPVWRMHETTQAIDSDWRGSRIQLMIDQANLLFGEVGTDDRPRFVQASQINQAEAMKFFVETMRTARPTRWGVIWWNLLDCWPQISDAVIDYYFGKKLAFDYLARSQQPILIAAGEANGWAHPVHAVNDTARDAALEWEITRIGDADFGLTGTTTLPAGASASIATVPVTPSTECYLFRWQAAVDGAPVTTGGNHYVAGASQWPLETYLSEWFGPIAALEPGFAGEDRWQS